MLRGFSPLVSMFFLMLANPKLMSQETRTYVLSVDFGSNAGTQELWLPWEQSSTVTTIQRTIPNVFDRSGVDIRITDPCDYQLKTCGLRAVNNRAVSGTPLNNLVRDGLRMVGDKVEFVFVGLPNGHYDLRFFFHDSAVSTYDGSLSLKITDSRSPNGKRISEDINFSAGTSPDAISTFRFPIEIQNSDKAIIQLDNSRNNFIINGFELNQYKSVDKLPSGIELIGPHRSVEALISGYLDSSTPILGCSIARNGREYFGRWYPQENQCLSLMQGNLVEDKKFKFVKFDPYFFWYLVGNPSVPRRSLIFTEDEFGDIYYPCVARISSTKFLPGVYIPKDLDFCVVYDDNDLEYFAEFYIYREK